MSQKKIIFILYIRHINKIHLRILIVYEYKL